MLLIRHETRGQYPGENEEQVPLNCLTKAARGRAHYSGRRLAELGYHIDVAFSSPQFRAIETLQGNLAGNRPDKGPIPLTGVNEAFGDALLGAFPFSPEQITAMKAEAATQGIPAEQLILTDSRFAATIADRGDEGADQLIAILHEHTGRTIAIASHGGSRIEPIIDSLTHRPEGAAIQIVPPGGTVVLKFDDLTVNSVEYLGNLGFVPAGVSP